MPQPGSAEIGFIGLGAMGLPMAKNLLAKQFRLRGFDTRQAAIDALSAAGGTGAATAAQAATGADTLILMVVNATQAGQILDTALDALAPGAVVILMATCAPAAAAALAARVTATGRRFVDAPVSGGIPGATAGTLTIMAAAPADTMAAAKPILDALGDKLFHVGDTPGQGAAVKTVNQLLAGVHIAVTAEAFAFAQKAGVDREILLQIMSGSAASSWMLRDRGPRMLQADPPTASAVDIFVKDLGLVLDAGRDAKAALPLAAIAHQLFLSAAGRGDGTADDSQVIRSYQALNGT
ncbi:MAG: NAD(P)-dependent oxidoreductase [Janthinobacterium lividum]